MKIAAIIIRSLLGLAFIVFGMNAFLHFMKATPPPGPAGDFMKVLVNSQYYEAIAILQVVGGVLCLSGVFTPLGLTLLGPVIVNILLFHIYLERTGLPIAIVVSVCALFLVWVHRSAFAGLVRPFHFGGNQK